MNLWCIAPNGSIGLPQSEHGWRVPESVNLYQA